MTPHNSASKPINVRGSLGLIFLIMLMDIIGLSIMGPMGDSAVA